MSSKLVCVQVAGSVGGADLAMASHLFSIGPPHCWGRLPFGLWLRLLTEVSDAVVLGCRAVRPFIQLPLPRIEP